MLSYEEALTLLQSKISNAARVAHCIGVAEFAYKLASAIVARNPTLPIECQKVKVAALLHDIGRSEDGDHEINSIRILNDLGHPELAAIVMHGTLYEAMKLRGIIDPTLIPQTLENKIVAYADTRFRLAPVTLAERFEEILLRRAHEEEKIAALNEAKKRFSALEKELLDLSGTF